jgi:hypothetical protein
MAGIQSSERTINAPTRDTRTIASMQKHGALETGAGVRDMRRVTPRTVKRNRGSHTLHPQSLCRAQPPCRIRVRAEAEAPIR